MIYRLREHREASGMSQVELSVASGVSRTIISGLESGRISVTTTGTLFKLAEALNKNVTELFAQTV